MICCLLSIFTPPAGTTRLLSRRFSGRRRSGRRQPGTGGFRLCTSRRLQSGHRREDGGFISAPVAAAPSQGCRGRRRAERRGGRQDACRSRGFQLCHRLSRKVRAESTQGWLDIFFCSCTVDYGNTKGSKEGGRESGGAGGAYYNSICTHVEVM